MPIWNTGSVVEEATKLIPSLPIRLSGTNMNSMVDMARFKVERWTGASISTDSIAETYQPPILYYTCANVLSSMELEGADATEVRIGEFTVKKGLGSNTSITTKRYEELAEKELKDIGRRSNYYQTL